MRRPRSIEIKSGTGREKHVVKQGKRSAPQGNSSSLRESRFATEVKWVLLTPIFGIFVLLFDQLDYKKPTSE